MRSRNRTCGRNWGWLVVSGGTAHPKDPNSTRAWFSIRLLRLSVAFQWIRKPKKGYRPRKYKGCKA